MSYAEDMGYDGWDFEDVLEIQREQLREDWEELKSQGYLWEDRYFHRYKPAEISDSYLKNIIKYCETNYRPTEQVKMLKEELEKRSKKSEI